MPMLRRLWAGWVVASIALPAFAQSLGPAPALRVSQYQGWSKSATPTLSRAQVVSAYNTQYLPSGNVAANWNGSVSGCVVGTVATAYEQATLARANFYRLLAGLPGDVANFTDSKPLYARSAALIMDANNQLDHFPPANWACYSAQGYSGAGNSNLALGYSGVTAIDAYMNESGSYNAAAGHRRWILYPPQTRMAVGYTHGYGHALWVLGPFGTRPATPNGVAWPPRGYVPYQVLPPSNRWSFSYPGANFSNAQVSMTRNGVPLGAVTKEALAANFGDNTLVWRPSGVIYTAPAADVAYRVTVSGISGSGVPSSFQYDVIVIDPANVPAPAPCGFFCSGFEDG